MMYMVDYAYLAPSFFLAYCVFLMRNILHDVHMFQMFIDYNLYGMNMLHVAALKFRQPAVEGNTVSLAQNGATTK